MPKRKKYPTLPNGFGSIRYLGINRKNCYAVHPPCTESNEHGNYVRPKAICYVDDWYVGFAVLNAYHAGTYTPGDEIQFKSYRSASDGDLDAFCQRILTDHTANMHVENVRKEKNKTFAEVYEMFYDWKFGENSAKNLSESSRQFTKFAYKKCQPLHDRVFSELTLEELQNFVNQFQLGESSISSIVLLIKQMYTFAMPRKLCEENIGQYLTKPSAKEIQHGIPFTDDDLKILWKNKDNPTVEMILIMCYSGYRLSAYRTIEVNLDKWYFKGGIKTKASKDRIVPIHSAIQPLVQKRWNRDGEILKITREGFRKNFIKTLASLEIRYHHPHDCRHTFSCLCEKYDVREADRKRLLGHSFGSDITNGVYGHRTLEELRTEIEKIHVPDL